MPSNAYRAAIPASLPRGAAPRPPARRSRSRSGRLAPIALLLGSAVACSSTPDADTSQSNLVGPTTAQALTELDQIGATIRALYGPLDFKKERFGFDLDQELAKARAAIQASEAEGDHVRAIKVLLADLHDGHVSYDLPITATSSKTSSLPLQLAFVERAYVVAAQIATMPDVALGDELVSIDGVATADLEAAISPFATDATPAQHKQYIASQMVKRPFWHPAALKPKSDTATIVLKHADGTAFTKSIPWTVSTGGVEALVKASAAGASLHGIGPLVFGGTVPLFLSDAVKTALGIIEVAPKAETLASVQVTVPDGDASAPDAQRKIIFRGYKYRFDGKVILLVRVPSYSPKKGTPDDQIGWLAALLKDNLTATGGGDSIADAPADVLVIDETHNGGGWGKMAPGVASLLTSKPFGNYVEKVHADRKWIQTFTDQANGDTKFNGLATTTASERAEWVARAKIVEDAIDKAAALTDPVPLAGPSLGNAFANDNAGRAEVPPHPFVQWTRPVLVLTDELSASTADLLPALVQRNGLGKTFGTTTFGAGGSVETVMTLPFSQATLTLTRGLDMVAHLDGSAVTTDDYIENNGVTPDYPYEATLADFRAGLVEYATAFSKVAAGLQRP